MFSNPKRLTVQLVRVACAILAVFVSTAGRAWAGEQVLFSFGLTTGDSPEGRLIFDDAGNLYGTTVYGGVRAGTVFKLTPVANGGWRQDTLYSFRGLYSDGGNPNSSLVFDSQGNLYGAMYGGVFKLTHHPDGSWSESVLYRSLQSGTFSGLVFDALGNLYGVSSGHTDCIPDCGTVFELTPATSGLWTQTVLHTFRASGLDGTHPFGSPVFGRDGNLYGTTIQGGSTGEGSVFQLTPASGGGWTYALIYSFGSQPNDAAYPNGGLVVDVAGSLYGTSGGGSGNHGAVFEISSTSGGWAENVIYSIEGGMNGEEPIAPVAFDNEGNLFGSTYYGGLYTVCFLGCGTVFELMPSASGGWAEQNLLVFSNQNGAHPWGGLGLDAKGNLYGTTISGGSSGYGVIFEMTP